MKKKNNKNGVINKFFIFFKYIYLSITAPRHSYASRAEEEDEGALLLTRLRRRSPRAAAAATASTTGGGGGLLV
jgi:hypothetical protein